MSEIVCNAAVITMSHRVAKGERTDRGGDAVATLLQENGYCIAERHVIGDDRDKLIHILRRLADRTRIDLVVTTGGTGLSEFDVTPEATLAVIDRRLPGMEFAVFQAAVRKTPHAMLSRAVIGTRKKTLIINLPGSPGGAVENLQVLLPVLPHAIDLLQKKQVADAEHHFPGTRRKPESEK